MACVVDVENPVVGLAGVFGKMSRGWGTGLLGIIFFYVLKSGAMLPVLLSQLGAPGPSFGWQLYTFFNGLIICYMTINSVALATVQGEHILDGLNEVRGRVGSKAHAPILWMETFLKNLHHGYGLGFFGHILKPLKIDYAFVAKIVVAACTYGASYYTFTSHITNPECTLQASQRVQLKALLGGSYNNVTAMSIVNNHTCALEGVTIGSILELDHGA
eukprot:SAG31_NODE_5149_length_2713_cov_6.205903_1_plen_217_part_00